jgi:hypothetical protein
VSARGTNERRSLRAGVSAAALLAFGALAFNGCAQVIGAGDYHVDPGAGCQAVFMGLAMGGYYSPDPNFYVASVELRDTAGAPQAYRQFRVQAGPVTGTAALQTGASIDLAKCVDCAWVFDWDAADTSHPTRAWVASTGFLETAAFPADQSGRLDATLLQVRFVEAAYDNATGYATILDGGGCLYLESGHVLAQTCTTTSPNCAEGEHCQALTGGGGICQPD